MKIKTVISKSASKYQEIISRKLRRMAAPRFSVKKFNLWAAIKTTAILFFVAMVAAEYIDSRKTIPLNEKIGQMLMVGFRGTAADGDSYIAQVIKDINLGGVILFDYDAPSKSRPRNITGPEQTKKLAADLKSFSPKEPLLVALDAEGGRVHRLKPSMGFADIPSAEKLGKAGVGPAFGSYWELARQISELGFNANFGPVVDVNVDPENPVIGGLERSYSDDAQKIAPFARAFIAAHRSFGVITALKHFPGHGSSNSDSHLGLADVTATYKQEELTPYEQLIEENAVDAVMTAHIIDRNIDPDYPATLSPKFIQNILRQNLGFNGLVISDDMQMGAIVDNYGFEDAIIRSINAGCDILIFSNNGTDYDETIPYRARDIISKAVRDNRISKTRILQAYERIMKLKEKL